MKKNARWNIIKGGFILLIGILIGIIGNQEIPRLSPSNSSQPPTSTVNGSLKVENSSNSPNGLYTVEKVLNGAQANPWEYLLLKETSSQTGIQLLSHRVSNEQWETFNDKNWNQWGKYFYLSMKNSNGNDVAIVRVDGQPFSDGRYYFLLSEILEGNITLQTTPLWQSPNELVIIPQQKLALYAYILNADQKTIKKVSAGD